MADQEQLNVLRQGAEKWNQWRKKYHYDITEDPNYGPDYAGIYSVYLTATDLSGINLSGADLRRANLSHADLRRANLSHTDLHDAQLSGADLSNAELWYTDLSGANLSHANLSHADLSGTNLSDADLSGANLSRVNLSRVNLIRAKLHGADLRDASVGKTIFVDVDLSVVKGLETLEHNERSYIDIHTIYGSGGNIPETFLRGIGAPDSIIEYMHSLVGKPIEYYSCFISYSSKDQSFAERLYADLQSRNVRCWFAPHDIRIGDEFRSRIDESIRVHDKLLLILSEFSVKSQWVKKEVETAFEKERRRRKLVLFPIKLDETVTRTRQAWAADIRRMRYIGDFTGWKDHDMYQKALIRLLGDLKTEARKTEEP